MLAICYLIRHQSVVYKSDNSPTLKYFTVQALCSSLFLFSLSLPNVGRELLAALAFIVKMGAWPFHRWYITLLCKLNLEGNSTILIITWQKVLPSYFLVCLYGRSLISTVRVELTALLSILISTIMLKGSLSFRSVLAISSFNGGG